MNINGNIANKNPDENEETYALATCYIEFKETDFALAVKRCDKELTEVFMAEAYACWCSQDAEECILSGYNTDAICQACYGDFITAWVREKGIPCNEDIGLISLDGHCVDGPPMDEDGFQRDISEWRDEHVTYYWFRIKELEEYLISQNTSLSEFLEYWNRDDVDCDILQNLEYIFKFTERAQCV